MFYKNYLVASLLALLLFNSSFVIAARTDLQSSAEMNDINEILKPCSPLVKSLIQSREHYFLERHSELRRIVRFGDEWWAIEKIASGKFGVDSVRAAVIFGYLLTHCFKVQEAARFLQMATQKGSAEAPAYLARLFDGDDRDPLIRNDMKKTMSLYQLSVSRGYLGGWLGLWKLFANNPADILEPLKFKGAPIDVESEGYELRLRFYLSEKIVQYYESTGELVIPNYRQAHSEKIETQLPSGEDETSQTELNLASRQAAKESVERYLPSAFSSMADYYERIENNSEKAAYYRGRVKELSNFFNPVLPI